MSSSRYAVFRYKLVDEGENVLGEPEHFAAFEEVRGETAPYRVRDPEQGDFKNFIFDLESRKTDGFSHFSFGVGYQITERPEHQYDKETEKVRLVMADANDMRYTRGVFVPVFGVAAFRDGSGDALNAVGGIGRVAAIFEYCSSHWLEHQLTASQQDVDMAIEKLKLVEMRFEVRPFNPHPAVPGDELHRLLEIAKVDKLSAVAKATDGGSMSPEAGGLVSEAQGMSNKGYGAHGATAFTQDGAKVSYKKKPMSGDREKDQAADEKPRQLHISVEKGGEDGAEERRVVRALIEIYGAN